MNVTSEKMPLWQQLQAVAEVLQAIRSGVSGTAAMAQVAPALRPGVQALLFHVLRSLGRAQELRHLLAKRAPPPPADALLCTALALAWHEQDAPYETFTLVNQTVEAAKKMQPRALRPASSMPVCAGFCGSATSWWRPPTRTLWRSGTTRSGGLSSLKRTGPRNGSAYWPPTTNTPQ